MTQRMDLTTVPRELGTRDLCLRPLNMEDAEGLFSMLSDPESMKYWSKPPLSEIDQAKDVLQKDLASDANGKSLCWAVTLGKDQRMIGKCILFHLDEQNKRAEIGYILNRLYWRRGLASQALQAVIEFAFKTLDLHRIEADVDPDNTASLALLEKLGFKREGLFRDRWLADGQWIDSVMLGLINTQKMS